MNSNNFVFLTPYLMNNSNFHPSGDNIFPLGHNQLVFNHFPFLSISQGQLFHNPIQFEASVEVLASSQLNSAKVTNSSPKSRNKERINQEQNLQQPDHARISKEMDQKGNQLSCQCQMSRCVKYYCFCFKNGKGCNEKCACTNCKNIRDRLKSKKSLSKRKLTLCNCLRTECQKKYCECYAIGKKCGKSCNCVNCLN